MADEELSNAFVAFARSVLSGVTRRAELEDFDLGALAQLAGAEREAAEMLLVERLEEHAEDPRVARALARMGTPSAYAAMRKALPDYPPGHAKVALARALWQSDGSSDAIEALLDTLSDALEPAARADAAEALSAVPGARVDRALVDAMRDPGSERSRSVATSALLERHGIREPSLRADRELTEVLDHLRVVGPDRIDDALAALERVAARLRA